jgi:hypothetical protein
MLNDGTSHQDLGADYFDRRSPDAKARRLVAPLSRLGFKVQLLRPLARPLDGPAKLSPARPPDRRNPSLTRGRFLVTSEATK